MIGTGAISLFGAATQFLIMTILGIPLALPLAVLAIFGGFIPYIGSLITTGLAFLVTVAYGTPQDIAIMGDLHDRVQHRAGQLRGADRLQPGRQPPSGGRPGRPSRPATRSPGIIGMFLVVPFLGVVAAVWRTVLRVLDTEPVDALEPPETDVVAPDPALALRPRRPRPRADGPAGRTWDGAGRSRRGGSRTRAVARGRVAVRPGQIPRALALAAANSSSDRMPWAWSSASFSSWAIVGSSGAAGAGARVLRRRGGGRGGRPAARRPAPRPAARTSAADGG